MQTQTKEETQDNPDAGGGKRASREEEKNRRVGRKKQEGGRKTWEPGSAKQAAEQVFTKEILSVAHHCFPMQFYKYLQRIFTKHCFPMH